jgi:cell wall-associated NlpC family hydrolase
MMWCYGKVGIHLSHSSGEQINEGYRVSRKDLQPGDLVFFGSPIHHVGMYIGGGKMIEAPYTGASVRIASMDRGDYAGACRPH